MLTATVILRGMAKYRSQYGMGWDGMGWDGMGCTAVLGCIVLCHHLSYAVLDCALLSLL
jgi:hypothetical protein